MDLATLRASYKFASPYGGMGPELEFKLSGLSIELTFNNKTQIDFLDVISEGKYIRFFNREGIDTELHFKNLPIDVRSMILELCEGIISKELIVRDAFLGEGANIDLDNTESRSMILKEMISSLTETFKALDIQDEAELPEVR